MGWGVTTSTMLEYVKDGVGCDNVDDTWVRYRDGWELMMPITLG